MKALDQIRILIADAHLLSRMGLRQLLEPVISTDSLAEASSEEEMWSVLNSQAIELVILDYDQVPHFSVDTITLLRQKLPELGVLVISAAQDKASIYRVLEVGVHGFLTKTCDQQEILDAVKATARSEKFYCTKILDHLLEKSFSRDAPPAQDEDCSPILLSPRETDILQLMAKGLISKEIASELNLSTHTVYTHRKNMMKKLKLRSSSEILLYALNQGLLKADT